MKLIKNLILCILCLSTLSVQAERTAASTDTEAIKTTVRALYKSIKFYQYDDIRALVTPEFEMTFEGIRMNGPEFVATLQAGEVEYDPDEPAPLHRQYKLTDFEIEVAGDVAFAQSTYADKDPKTADYYDLMVLRRDQQNDGRWRVHIHFHMPKAKINAATKE